MYKECLHSLFIFLSYLYVITPIKNYFYELNPVFLYEMDSKISHTDLHGSDRMNYGYINYI